MADDGEELENDDPPRTWAFPGARARNDGEDDDVAGRASTHLCSLPEAAALKLCERLEAHGLPCDSAQDDAGEGDLIVLVRPQDLAAAEEILRTPAEHTKLVDADEEEDIEARQIRSWVCPRCRKRTLEVVPLRGLSHWIRVFLVIVAASPFVLKLFVWTLPDEANRDMSDRLNNWLPYLMLATILAVVLLVTMPRRKICAKCGFQPGMNQSD